MLRAFLIAVVVLSSGLGTGTLTAQEPKQVPVHHLVRVKVKDARHMIRLLKLDLDLAACHSPEAAAKEVEVIATDADILRIQDAGFQLTIAIKNLEDHYQRELAKAYKPGPLTGNVSVSRSARAGDYECFSGMPFHAEVLDYS